MPPEREIFIDHAIAEARAHGFAFDLRTPVPRRADRDEAWVKIKGDGAWATLRISPDGTANARSTSPAHDQNLSKLVKKLLAWNEKMLRKALKRQVAF